MAVVYDKSDRECLHCVIMSRISKFIKETFKNHPIISNCVIYGSLCFGAEFSQQTISRKILVNPPQPYDTSTIARYSIYGSSFAGPILTFWYRWLDKKYVGTASKIIVKKLLLDQFFLTPQLIVVFYVAMSIMERKKDLLSECKEKFVPTFKSSCMFWLPAQGINFLFIPPAFRVVYVGSCSFAWVNILCWIKRQEYELTEKPEDDLRED